MWKTLSLTGSVHVWFVSLYVLAVISVTSVKHVAIFPHVLILLWFWVFLTRNVHKTKYLKKGPVEVAIYLHEILHLRWAPTWRTLNLHKCTTSAANRELLNINSQLLENTCVMPTIRGTKIYANNLPSLRSVVGNFIAYFTKCSLSKEKNLNWTLNLT